MRYDKIINMTFKSLFVGLRFFSEHVLFKISHCFFKTDSNKKAKFKKVSASMSRALKVS